MSRNKTFHDSTKLSPLKKAVSQHMLTEKKSELLRRLMVRCAKQEVRWSKESIRRVAERAIAKLRNDDNISPETIDLAVKRAIHLIKSERSSRHSPQA